MLSVGKGVKCTCMMVANVAVIGAGVVGLSTATRIQLALPDATVKVIADKLYSETCSFGSGGGFLVTLFKDSTDEEVQLQRKWARNSWDHYKELATGPLAGEAGAIICMGYDLLREGSKAPLHAEFNFNYRRLPDDELKKLGFPAMYKVGYQSTTVILDQRKYLKFLMNRFLARGGLVEKRKIGSLQELVGKFDVVVNCAGIGSKELARDDKVFPVRGVIVRVKAPWIKHWVFTDDLTYFFPGENYLGLGGYKTPGKTSLEVTQEEVDDILERCYKLCPNLKGAEIDHTWAGLRPGRHMIRVESETLNFKKGQLKVVHNYGHHSNGVGYSWGTANDAKDLVLQALDRKAKL